MQELAYIHSQCLANNNAINKQHNYTHCIDFDECADSSYHNCSESEYVTCTNTPGSFSCGCKVGFKMNEETNICEGENVKYQAMQA